MQANAEQSCDKPYLHEHKAQCVLSLILERCWLICTVCAAVETHEKGASIILSKVFIGFIAQLRFRSVNLKNWQLNVLSCDIMNLQWFSICYTLGTFPNYWLYWLQNFHGVGLLQSEGVMLILMEFPYYYSRYWHDKNVRNLSETVPLKLTFEWLSQRPQSDIWTNRNETMYKCMTYDFLFIWNSCSLFCWAPFLQRPDERQQNTHWRLEFELNG